MPTELSETSDQLEPGQNYVSSYLAPGEVLAMTWQGGGGYGDPLSRDPAAVAHDLREEKITAGAARTVYGVVLDGHAVDETATAAERTRQREDRRDRSEAPAPAGAVDVTAGRRLDDNLVEVPAGDGHLVACRHCGESLGAAGSLALARYEGPATVAGSQIIATASDYVDAPVVFRQYCCPGCWTAVSSAVVPADHVDGSAASAGWPRRRSRSAGRRRPAATGRSRCPAETPRRASP